MSISIKTNVKLFSPPDAANKSCCTCGKPITITAERHYIVWNPRYDNGHHNSGKRRHRGNYVRQCAQCYDRIHQRPYERRTITDAIIHSTTATGD